MAQVVLNLDANVKRFGWCFFLIFGQDQEEEVDG